MVEAIGGSFLMGAFNPGWVSVIVGKFWSGNFAQLKTR